MEVELLVEIGGGLGALKTMKVVILVAPLSPGGHRLKQ